MSKPPLETQTVLDRMILNSAPGTLLVPICARELFVLRSIGTNWQRVVKAVVEAHGDLVRHETAFGPVDFKLYLTRKYTQDSVIGTLVQEIQLPQEIFEWPLSK